MTAVDAFVQRQFLAGVDDGVNAISVSFRLTASYWSARATAAQLQVMRTASRHQVQLKFDHRVPQSSPLERIA
jgi:hypothetical protein